MKKVIEYLFVIASILIILTPIVFVNREKDVISEKEKRPLANPPTASFGSDEYKTQLSAWLSDNIGFRDELLDLRTDLLFNKLGIVTSQLVHKGTDGWYFYTADQNLEIATGEYQLTQDDLQIILENHLKIRDKLAQKGSDYVIVFPVSKVSVYPEYLGFGDGTITQTPADIVADYIEKNSDLKVIRLKQALLDEKENHQVYFKTDTHWTEYGAYAVYKKIINDMNNMGLCHTPPKDVEFKPSTYKGEFSAMLGNNNALPAEETAESEIISPNAIKNEEDQIYNNLAQALASSGHNYPWYHYRNPSVNDSSSVMWFGDSLFAYWNATELLAENFSEFSYIWSYEIYEAAIDCIQPSVVIYEMGERYLNQFQYKNRLFLSEKLSNYSSEIVSYEIIDNKLNVTVLNNSSSVWNETNLIRCCLLMNNEDWGIRAYIPSGLDVAPGETITFSFENIVSPIENADTVEISMLQEGIMYFGDRKSLKSQTASDELDAEIIAHNAPAAVNHSESYNIDITVKNTGTSTWSESDQIRLCIWQDGADCGYRIQLPDNQTVGPGSEYTFSLTGFVLPELDVTTLEFQMVKERIMYFGEREPVVIAAE